METRRARVIRGVGAILIALITLGTLLGYAVMPSLARHLPHTAWFVILLAVAVLGLGLALDWMKRRYLS